LRRIGHAGVRRSFWLRKTPCRGGIGAILIRSVLGRFRNRLKSSKLSNASRSENITRKHSGTHADAPENAINEINSPSIQLIVYVPASLDDGGYRRVGPYASQAQSPEAGHSRSSSTPVPLSPEFSNGRFLDESTLAEPEHKSKGLKSFNNHHFLACRS